MLQAQNALTAYELAQIIYACYMLYAICYMHTQIIYLLRELWRGRSAREGEAPRFPGGDKGLMRATSHLCLTRWDVEKLATVDNLVGVMSLVEFSILFCCRFCWSTR